jgi:hypothetical protein
MNEEEYLSYSSSILYLGKRGITRPCVKAMAGILTSAFQPKKITAVIGSWKEPGPFGGTQPVLFLVWDWCYSPNLTIIPDGFGTHSGEGGRGLSAALGLIKYYKIPLRQLRVYEQQEFWDLAEGTLTEATFAELQQDWEYNWNFHPVSPVRKVKRGTHHFLEVEGDNGNVELKIQLP